MPTGVYIRSQEHKDKLANHFKGSKNPNYRKVGALNHRWKGDEADPYQRVHRWMRYNFGKASKCENDDRHTDAAWYEWANLSGDYLYDLGDWAQLCRRCHSLIDNKGAHLRNRMTVKTLPPS